MNLSPEITVREGVWSEVANMQKYVHLVIVATKPDLIKQAPFYHTLKSRGESVLLLHTGQHYDFNLSGGLEEEFGLVPDFNLNVRGSLAQKMSQIIARAAEVLEALKSLNKIPVPYVHGDTTTCQAFASAAWASEVGVVHVEAGLRTLTPKREILAQTLEKDFDVQKYFAALWEKENWEKGSIEPYPEQYNTRTAEPATGVHLAGTELHREFLLAEGFRDERIFVVGNSVVDAMAEVREQAKASKIFETYPHLKDGFIRFCIHRRENCADEKRFTTIFAAMEKLVQKGETVLLISLNATESALDNFKLRARLEELKKYENFIYSSVWPYYQDVVAAMEQCSVCATDSGSMQEEMNEMRVPCVTLRYGTDRPESVFALGNVIAPPVSSEAMVEIILEAKDLPRDRIQKIYGEKVAEKGVEIACDLLAKGEPLFCYEQHRLKF